MCKVLQKRGVDLADPNEASMLPTLAPETDTAPEWDVRYNRNRVLGTYRTWFALELGLEAWRRKSVTTLPRSEWVSL